MKQWRQRTTQLRYELAIVKKRIGVLLCVADGKEYTFFPIILKVAYSTWSSRRLGFDGALLGTSYIQIPPSRARGPLFPAGMLLDICTDLL